VVGRLSREKGQRLALEALRLANAQLPAPIALDIVGEGPDRVELERLTERLDLRRQVTFHGFLANPYPLIHAADLVCIPSEHEGLPNVALEAMALRTGVVATACSGSLQTLIGKNERGALVAVGDAPALAAEFANAAQAMTIWTARCAAASGWVEKHHALAPWLTGMQTALSGLVR